MIHILFLVCIATGVIIHFKDSWHTIWEEVLQTSVAETMSLFFLTALYYILDALITYYMMHKYHTTITLKACLFSSFYCTFLGIATMGSGGGIGEIHYFHTKGISSPIAGSICIIKYVIKKIAIVIYGLIGFITIYVLSPTLVISYGNYLIIGIVFACSIIVFLLAILTWRWFSTVVFRFLKKIISHQQWRCKIKSFEKDIQIFQITSKKILKDPSNVIIACFLNICKLTCIYLFPLLHFAMDIHSYITIVLLMSICNMLAGVIPTPYGFGSLEFICVVLFGQMVMETKIISMLLLFRFFTDVFPLTIGAICFLQMRRKRKYVGQELISFQDMKL